MTLFLDDGDVRLHLGDSLEVLRTLPDGSVDMCVTSPPYWGLRDYGTGEWDGGDPSCDHDAIIDATAASVVGTTDLSAARARISRNGCPQCGATRVDRQRGLEATPGEYVAGMVDVFREVRRVLAPHGTLWLNLGDSYAGNGTTGRKESISTRLSYPGSAGDALKPKDLVGIPWRVAFALQADGWWLRSDVIWAKPNPMPESITDRPTKAHEYVFLLAGAERYYFDGHAIREADSGQPAGNTERRPNPAATLGRGDTAHAIPWRPDGTGRNARSVWTITTRPFRGAHFAVFPPEIPQRCISAGCPEHVCRECGQPRRRIVKVERPTFDDVAHRGRLSGQEMAARTRRETAGWTDCGHNAYRPGIVLDPFAGSGTTLEVARRLGRHAVGIELNPAYAEIAAARLQQLSLLGGLTA